jgi:hypothetical protein
MKPSEGTRARAATPHPPAHRIIILPRIASSSSRASHHHPPAHRIIILPRIASSSSRASHHHPPAHRIIVLQRARRSRNHPRHPRHASLLAAILVLVDKTESRLHSAATAQQSQSDLFIAKKGREAAPPKSKKAYVTNHARRVAKQREGTVTAGRRRRPTSSCTF